MVEQKITGKNRKIVLLNLFYNYGDVIIIPKILGGKLTPFTPLDETLTDQLHSKKMNINSHQLPLTAYS